MPAKKGLLKNILAVLFLLYRKLRWNSFAGWDVYQIMFAMWVQAQPALWLGKTLYEINCKYYSAYQKRNNKEFSVVNRARSILRKKFVHISQKKRHRRLCELWFYNISEICKPVCTVFYLQNNRKTRPRNCGADKSKAYFSIQRCGNYSCPFWNFKKRF